jgi:hypothetical protein
MVPESSVKYLRSSSKSKQLDHPMILSVGVISLRRLSLVLDCGTDWPGASLARATGTANSQSVLGNFSRPNGVTVTLAFCKTAAL